ncbi:hypothetical protein [Nostoc sp.]|uniref:hypothetical protein n=1 Tax=Nostoc sp. TaxID=1180 RepID=UPI002FF68247
MQINLTDAKQNPKVHSQRVFHCDQGWFDETLHLPTDMLIFTHPDSKSLEKINLPVRVGQESANVIYLFYFTAG